MWETVKNKLKSTTVSCGSVHRPEASAQEGRGPGIADGDQQRASRVRVPFCFLLPKHSQEGACGSECPRDQEQLPWHLPHSGSQSPLASLRPIPCHFWEVPRGISGFFPADKQLQPDPERTSFQPHPSQDKPSLCWGMEGHGDHGPHSLRAEMG